MRTYGINYDTGFSPMGEISRPDWDFRAVRDEMRVIANELHCDAVRISGGEVERLSAAAEAAAEAGLAVWFAPFPCDLTEGGLLEFFAECAGRAEDVRSAGTEVVFVAGCEISLFNPGFFAGQGFPERLAGFGAESFREHYPEAMAKLNGFLHKAANTVRSRFGGRLTYASGPWERIDWTPFDIVGVDAYRAAYNAGNYREELRAHLTCGKPVAATEFGCCTYRGAAQRGGEGWMIVDEAARPPRIDGDYQRDEHEQAQYLDELLTVFEEEGLDAAFWFTFAGYGLTHRPDDPQHDLDLASYGVVKIVPGGWEPKESFRVMAARYANRPAA
ncbi:MAG TPA: hypothetical protein VJT49_32295 [Amycolatopsis sp.]|uniref:hypothetical protein n=1 Tax=Amycolatopsis sp. TaxID=37632 RepID=UPI002B48AA39|nr:hypothetical protein [Amycolatopsis sp.]HKS49704.1 hypothetical protein [Amycolatopsis sp.]